MPSVLIIEDERLVSEMIGVVLHGAGYETTVVEDGETALARYRESPFDVVLVDILMKPMDGLTVLEKIMALDPGARVAVMTGLPSLERAVRAFRLGAFDFFPKPLAFETLKTSFRKALDRTQHHAVGAPVGDDASAPDLAAGAGTLSAEDALAQILVGDEKPVARARGQAERLLPRDAPVLIEGEAGTGKARLAQWFHSFGPTASGPLVLADLAQASTAELQRNLIGPGDGGKWLRDASGGTLILQHIEDLPLSLQHEVAPLLDSKEADFRLVTTAACSLEGLLDEGTFSEELYFLLGALPLALPPLRETLNDLPKLVQAVARRSHNPHLKPDAIVFTDAFFAALRQYDWPANRRELRQVVTAAVASARVPLIEADALPRRLRPLSEWPSLEVYLAEEQAAYVEAVQQRCGGDRDHMAEILGVDGAGLQAIEAGQLLERSTSGSDTKGSSSELPKRVFLVDHDDVWRPLVARTLRQRGVQVEEFSHALEALLEVEETDAVDEVTLVASHKLPVVDGEGLLAEWIRLGQNGRFIFILDEVQDRERLEALDDCVAGCVGRPAAVSRLPELVCA